MGDLISREMAIETVSQCCAATPVEVDVLNCAIVALGAFVPSVDAVPVVHGRWLTHDWVYGVAYCSNCAYELKSNNTKFCPNCGAKMDGERRNTDGKDA